MIVVRFSLRGRAPTRNPNRNLTRLVRLSRSKGSLGSNPMVARSFPREEYPPPTICSNNNRGTLFVSNIRTQTQLFRSSGFSATRWICAAIVIGISVDSSIPAVKPRIHVVPIRKVSSMNSQHHLAKKEPKFSTRVNYFCAFRAIMLIWMTNSWILNPHTFLDPSSENRFCAPT